MDKRNALILVAVLGAGLSSLGCGGEARTSSEFVSAGGSAGKGEGAGGSSGGAVPQAGSPGAGMGGGSYGTGGSSGSSAGDGGAGGDCFKLVCGAFRGPQCKDANTLTTYRSPTYAEAPCGASCISIPTDTPCGPKEQCVQSTPVGPACVDPVAMCTHDQASYQKSRSVLLASSASCTVDTDCALLTDNNACNVGCGTPVAAVAQAKVLSTLNSLAGSECGTCPPVQVPPCALFHAVCMQGECALAH